MKRLLICLLAVVMLCGLVSCGSVTDDAGDQPQDKTPEITAGTTPDTTPDDDTTPVSDTPESTGSDNYVSGETAILGDWEITVNSIEFTQSIASSYGSFNADDGNQYCVIDLTVKNNGSAADVFINSYPLSGQDTILKVVYKETYEYSSSNLLGHADDLHNQSTNPLTSKTGIIAFQVVQEAIDNKQDLLFTMSLGKETVSYSMD